MIIQSGFATLVFVLLLAAERWLLVWKSKHATDFAQENLKDGLVAANVKFYKAKCTLAGAIQIACMAFVGQMSGNGLVEYGLFSPWQLAGMGL